MKYKYPTKITEEIAQNLSHIPDAELQEDIDDTQAEIALYTKMYGKGHDKVQQREGFVAFLKLLQEYRKE